MFSVLGRLLLPLRTEMSRDAWLGPPVMIRQERTNSSNLLYGEH